MRFILALTSVSRLAASLSTMSTSSVIYPGFESALANDALKGKLFAVTGCIEADRAALWSASEAAIGEKWEL